MFAVVASAKISLRQGNGAVGFAPAVRFATGSRPTSLTLGNINNVDLFDLIATNPTHRQPPRAGSHRVGANVRASPSRSHLFHFHPVTPP